MTQASAPQPLQTAQSPGLPPGFLPRALGGLIIFIGALGLAMNALQLAISGETLMQTVMHRSQAVLEVKYFYPLKFIKLVGCALAVVGGLAYLQGKRWGYHLLLGLCIALMIYVGAEIMLLLLISHGLLVLTTLASQIVIEYASPWLLAGLIALKWWLPTLLVAAGLLTRPVGQHKG